MMGFEIMQQHKGFCKDFESGENTTQGTLSLSLPVLNTTFLIHF